MRFKELRNKRDLTQLEVAEYLGITRAAYTNIENGKREADYNTLTMLARLYKVPIGDLFDFDTNTVEQKKDITKDAQLILKLYESLDDKDKAKAEGFLAALADQDKS